MKPKGKRPRREFEGFLHRPPRVCSHVAQEVRESPVRPDGMTGPAAAEEFVRNLTPWAARNALGLGADTPARHKGWSPSVKPDRLAA